MAKMNLQKLSTEALNTLAAEIDHERQARRAADIKAAREKMDAIAASVGMTVEQLLKAGRKSKGIPKDQNPDHPVQTWTGSGRHPQWIKAWLVKGNDLAELEI